MRELERELEYHSHKYYVENAPEISDFEFDALLRELQELEIRYPEFADQNSPTKRVGSDLTTEFQSVEHRYAMQSLSNTCSTTFGSSSFTMRSTSFKSGYENLRTISPLIVFSICSTASRASAAAAR